MRKEKVARFIGITSHTNPVTLKTALQRHDFDCVQMALNAAMQGAYENSARPGNSFEQIALPVARQKNMGILAMKATGRNELVGAEPTKAPAQDLIRYALSLPIAVAVIGMGDPQHVKANAELAKTFKPMSKAEMTSLMQRVAGQRAALHGFFAGHQDA
jgi:predicted aldo/keto reductase-like oxidoreductase